MMFKVSSIYSSGRTYKELKLGWTIVEMLFLLSKLILKKFSGFLVVPKKCFSRKIPNTCWDQSSIHKSSAILEMIGSLGLD